MKNLASVLAIIGSVVLFAANSSVCGAAPSGGAGQLQPAAKPGMVYVADFALEVSQVKEGSGILGQGGLLQGGLMKRRGPLRQEDDPAATAANLVNLLAESISRKLNDESVPAMRLPRGQALPGNGWLVRGEFLQVDEGNRLSRAVIGFGAGASDMQVSVEVCDLGSHPDTPFLVFGAETGSGKKPGAIVTMNPYVAAAKFVLSKDASEKDVKHAGAQIASEIVNYMKARGLLGAN